LLTLFSEQFLFKDLN